MKIGQNCGERVAYQHNGRQDIGYVVEDGEKQVMVKFENALGNVFFQRVFKGKLRIAKPISYYRKTKEKLR